MQIISCGRGHYFDRDKFLSCPHCSHTEAGVSEEKLLGENQTNVSSEKPIEKSILEYEKQFRRNAVGWLVCLEGKMKGESFTLREGDNHIGRSMNMDIPLCYEPTVSRKNHAIISYEPEDSTYFLHAMDPESIVYVNHKQIKRKKKLKKNDTVILGECILLFIPLCDNSFHWE